MTPYGRPSAQELHAALELDARDPSTYHERLSAHARALLARERVREADDTAFYAAGLARFGATDESALARGVRAGRYVGRERELAEFLDAVVRRRLAVSNPGYVEGDGAAG